MDAAIGQCSHILGRTAIYTVQAFQGNTIFYKINRLLPGLVVVQTTGIKWRGVMAVPPRRPEFGGGATLPFFTHGSFEQIQDFSSGYTLDVMRVEA